MTEIDIETLEQKYLNTIKSLVEGNLHNILRNLDSMNEISEYWRDISTDEGLILVQKELFILFYREEEI